MTTAIFSISMELKLINACGKYAAIIPYVSDILRHNIKQYDNTKNVQTVPKNIDT